MDPVAIAVAERARLVRYGTKLSRDPQDGEDLAHEAYLRVLPVLHTIDPPEKIPAVLTVTLKRVWIDWVRRSQRIRMVALSVDVPADNDDDDDPGARLALLARVLADMVEQGNTLRDIAVMAGLSYGRLRNILSQIYHDLDLEERSVQGLARWAEERQRVA